MRRVLSDIADVALLSNIYRALIHTWKNMNQGTTGNCLDIYIKANIITSPNGLQDIRFVENISQYNKLRYFKNSLKYSGIIEIKCRK